MWHIKQKLQGLTERIPIRWRLTLISLGLITVLLSGLGFVVLFTAERALLNNQAEALRSEGFQAVKGIKSHPFVFVPPPGPPAGPLSPEQHGALTVLVDRLTSGFTDASALAPDGSILVSSNNSPSPFKLSSTQIQQTLAASSQDNHYLLMLDTHKQRQLVVLIPLVSNHHTVAILQLSMPTATPIDQFITTLRFILLLGVGGALGIAIALTGPLIGAALRPLVEMEHTSRRIAGGALSMRLATPATNDEIGRLTLSFNQMVEQLEAVFSRQKQFVADASHELRTPLTVLRGSLEMLLMGVDRGDIETSRRLAHSMSSEVLRMQRLVEDLLALTRLDEGKMVLREDAIDIHTIIDKVYDQAQQLAHGQEIRSKIAPDISLARADADRLQQVLLNIVENALKYTPANGHVELVAYNEGQESVLIEVRDNGKGIPSSALPHVFDRFYRVDPARSRLSRHVGGNGLGLAIARELIEAQGGTITIRSIFGKGTIVTIRLRAIVGNVMAT
jgi:two-component system OmpR family sensor kinase